MRSSIPNRRIVVLAVAIGFYGGPDARAERSVKLTTVESTQDLERRVERLEVSTQAGNIEIVEGQQLQITAEVRVKEARLAEVRGLTGFGDHVRVHVESNRMIVEDAHHDADDRNDWSVSLKIAVPRSLEMEVTTGAGNVTIERATEHVEAVSGAGNVILKTEHLTHLSASSGAGNVQIDIDSFAGNLAVQTGAGNLSVEVGSGASEGQLKMHSGTGNVSLDLPRGAQGAFELSSGMGRVSTSGLDGLPAGKHGMGGTISGAVGSGGPAYELNAGIGNVSVAAR